MTADNPLSCEYAVAGVTHPETGYYVVQCFPANNIEQFNMTQG